jgi:hypothetical protein
VIKWRCLIKKWTTPHAYLEQWQPGTFEHAIHYLIDNKPDLSIFHNKYQNEDNARSAYDPAVL